MPPVLSSKHPPLPLEEIKSISDTFDQLSRQKQFDAIDRLVSVHPVLSLQWGGQKRYRRSRVLTNDQGVDNVSGLVWRTDKSPSMGRANPANWPVLYLASQRDTALAEVGAKDNDAVVLTEFIIRPPSGIHIAPVGEMSQIARTGRGRLVAMNDNPLIDIINACSRKDAISLLATDELLAEILLNRSDDYLISSRVAYAMFSKSPKLQGVVFPSTRHNGGVNYAIRTSDFWAHWGVVSVTTGKAKHIAGGYYLVEPCRNVYEINDRGDLLWSDDELVDGTTSLLDPPWFPKK